MISEIQQNSVKKPRISVTETKVEPILETKKPKKEEDKSIIETNGTLSKLESIFQNTVPVIEEEPEEIEEKIVKKDEPKIEKIPIMKFDSFK